MIRKGQPIALRSGAIPGYPVMTIVQVDERAQKVQIRFARPPGAQGYSYLFWRDIAEVQGEPAVTHTTGDQGGEDHGRYAPEA